MVSFDVFDTLIKRRCIYPEGVFEIMQQKLNSSTDTKISQDVLADFVTLRKGAESTARKTYCRDGIQDVTLEQIYEVLVKTHHITDEDARYLCCIERNVEIEEALPITDNIDLLKQYVNEGERVIIISDMYLDESTIRKILLKASDIFKNIKIYVSSSYPIKNKWSGDLFKYIRECESVDYCDWIHIGDNDYSDYEVPTELGIRCQQYVSETKSQQLRDEISTNIHYESDNLPYQIGRFLGGPILIPYAKWIVTKCKEDGINRLYFVARDGYVIKAIVDAIIRAEGISIKTSYIYGSRIAWRIPNSDCIIDDVWKIFNQSYQDRIFGYNDLAAFFQISVEEIREYLPQHLLDDDKVWTLTTTKAVVAFLLQNVFFVDKLETIYANKRNLMRKYLSQCVDSSDSGYAMVDLAGSGLTMEYMAEIMQYQSMKTFYFRMDSTKCNRCDNYVFYPYQVDYFTMLEMFCRAPQGQTTGYHIVENDEAVPVFNETDKRAILEYGIEEYYQGVLDCYTGKSDSLFSRKEIEEVLKRIYYAPSKEELAFFSDIPNMLTGRENELSVFAPKLTDEDIRDIYLNRNVINREYFYKGSDFEYSLLRCTQAQREYIAKLMLDEVPVATMEVLDHFNSQDGIKDEIIIYGAGRRGTRLAKLLRNEKTIVAVIDQDVTKRIEGISSISINDISDVKFEQIVITIADKNIAKEVAYQLVELGVDSKKILFY